MWQNVVDNVVPGKVLVFPKDAAKTSGITGITGRRSSGDREVHVTGRVEVVREKLRVVHDLIVPAGGEEAKGEHSINTSTYFEDIPECVTAVTQ